MKKFFFFKRYDTENEGSFYSDSGNGLTSLAISTEFLSYMTANYGSVRMFFNSATPYEENNLLEGQSFEKTNVEVYCDPGKEFDLMEDIMNFISRPDTKKSIMRFDYVSETSTFPNLDMVKSSKAIVPSIPVDRGTFGSKNISSGTVIAGVDFYDTNNLPLIDYNESKLTGNAGTDISAWDNDDSATLTSSDYDLAQGIASNRPVIAAPDNIVSTKYVDFYDATNQEYMGTTTDVTIQREFVLYCAVVINKNTPAQPFYSSKLGIESTGLFPPNAVNDLKIRFNDNDASIIKTSIKFPSSTIEEESSESSLYVFVVRRDSHGDLHIYDRNGDIIAKKPASRQTEGTFDFQYIGGVLDKTKMKVARFGVVDKDLGDDMCKNIAQSLYKHYRV